MIILRNIFSLAMFFCMFVFVVALFATDEQMDRFDENRDYITGKVGQKADHFGDKFYRAFGRDFGIMLDNASASLKGLFETAQEETVGLQKESDRLVSKTKAAFNDFTILDCKAAKASDC